MIRRVARLPEWVPNELKRTIVALSDKWYQLSRGTQCVYAIVGLNAVVFGMWQVPRLLPFMIRRFLHDPRSGLSYTMLTSTFSHPLILPSLGASGAVYGVVGATMMMFPRAQIALIFLPFIPMTISQAFPALLAYDFVGAVLGWKTFNHIAHLGGGLYGIAYTEWGIEYWNKLVREIRRRRQEKS
ncbi:hypothetical protein LPJ63_004858 [Coemansia sp. RSA 2711]|nr:hypothetical protein LPJ63_004858 [Coemansia sp. RSA 2711]